MSEYVVAVRAVGTVHGRPLDKSFEIGCNDFEHASETAAAFATRIEGRSYQYVNVVVKQKECDAVQGS